MKRLFMAVIKNGEQGDENIFADLPVEFFPLPVSRIVTIPENLYKLDLSRFQWIFFASANSVKIVYDAGFIDFKNISHRIACVGSGTKEAVETRGGMVSFIPAKYTGISLAAEFLETYPEEKLTILLPRPEKMASPWVQELVGAGHCVTEKIIYRTEINDTEELHTISVSGEDLFVFKSPSGFNNFIRFYQLPELATAVAIGPTTAAVIEASGHKKIIVPPTYSREGLIESVKNIVFSQED